MKDLATQAADDTNSDTDRGAMQDEFTALNAELNNIMSNTSYGSEKLLESISGASGAVKVAGKLTKEMQFQIGASKDEVLKVNLSSQLSGVASALAALTVDGISKGVSGGNAMIGKVEAALNSVGTIRSAIGATINRLDHTSNNLANMKDNTNVNLGVIRDADIADEALKMSRESMLMQSSQGMLMQSNQMGQMLLKFIS